MSQAFVKEPDGDQAEDDLPDLPQSDQPNYITPSGFKKLQQKYAHQLQQKKQLNEDSDNLSAKTEIKQIERDLRFSKQRLERAIVVELSEHDDQQIRFGARVQLIDEDDQTIEFNLVGEDESCAATRRISWTSPLAKALLGRQAGDTILWERPIGNIELEIHSFDYSNLG